MKAKRLFKKYYKLVIAIIIITFLLFVAFFPNLFTSYGKKDVFMRFEPISKEHLLGTNDLGYDSYTELIYATKYTLLCGIISSLFAIALGILIGILAGYLKGGAIFNGIIQIFLLLPVLPLALVLGVYLKKSLFVEALIIGLLSFSSTAKIIRNKTMELKESEFIKHLKTLGYSNFRILFFHIVPNISNIILARYVVLVSRCIILEATLSFLGLGDITNPTWGTMISIAYRQGAFSLGRFNLFLGPAICIFLSSISANLLESFLLSRKNNVSGKSINNIEL